MLALMMVKEEIDMTSIVQRHVTVVFADHYHALRLVEVANADVKFGLDDHGFPTARVDRNAVEARARQRINDEKLGPLDETKYDFVGVLVAMGDVLAPGRINWAEEIETAPAVTL